MNFRENMKSLSKLSDAFSQHHLCIEEYRKKRKELLNLIDEELNGVLIQEEKPISDLHSDETFLDKALSFLKLDKV